MVTFFIIILLVAGISFMLGGAYQKARDNREIQLAFEEAEDARVFASYPDRTIRPDTMDAAFFEAFRLDRRPHLHVATDADVDSHFDELCRLGLVEQS